MSENELPHVDDIYVRRVFDALSKMDVDLDSDPLVYGPKRMIAKVAMCRAHLSRCQQQFLQISDDLHRLNRAHRKAKLDFDLQIQDLLANNPDVRAGKNVRDREAIATMMLRSQREDIAMIESSIQDLDAVMTVVKAKREDLKDIQGRIRDQLKLCQEELGLGGKWGSAPAPGVKAPNLDTAPKVDAEALALLNDILPGLEGESSISDLDQFVRKELRGRGDSDDESEEGEVIHLKVAPLKEVPTREDTVKFTAAEIASTPTAPAVEVKAPAVEVKAPKLVIAPKVVEADPLETFEVSEPETHLPEIGEKPNPAGSSASTAEIDSFFDDLDVGGSSTKNAAAAAPPISNEIDLDDLIGSFK